MFRNLDTPWKAHAGHSGRANEVTVPGRLDPESGRALEVFSTEPGMPCAGKIVYASGVQKPSSVRGCG